MVRRRSSIAILLAIALTAGVVVLFNHGPQNLIRPHASNKQDDVYSKSALATLPQKSASSANTSHLAAGIAPPTNSWFSGMVLQSIPQVVYPMPASFLARNNGFEIGLPTVVSTATSITGGHVPGIIADIGADNFRLSRYDKLSATLTYRNDTKDLGDLTLSEGSPFVFYIAKQPQVIKLSNIDSASILERNETYLRYTRAGQTYAISTNAGKILAEGQGLKITVPKGGLVTFYVLPGTDDTLKQYAANAIQSVDVTRNLTAKSAITKFNFRTSTGKPTVLATMPYERFEGSTLDTYRSIWGKMPVITGTSFAATVPTVAPANELDVSTFTAAEKQALSTALTADIAATTIDQKDSYFAGKQLARAANLLSLAEQLHQTESVQQLREILNTAFSTRFSADYFYYDTKLRGVAATTAAFGSEDFNDHHFHYGYWLYAGSIMAKYDQSFMGKYKDNLNLLAADIASYKSSADFPLYRNYDPYAGHSWAAGLAPFADGNNQESSSEAIHAWNGIALWGDATRNQALARTGKWLLANEANTAQKAWRIVDTSDAALANYTSPVASLNFSGKRTYTTFFSDEASAKLGIQLIPMDPSMAGFKQDKDTITKSVLSTIKNDNYNVPLGDYVLMYSSLNNPEAALASASKQTSIDDGNSKTYMLAWIYAQQTP